MEYRLLEIIPKNKQVIKDLLILYKEIFQVSNTNLLKENRYNNHFFRRARASGHA